jgi:hypothetical protein
MSTVSSSRLATEVSTRPQAQSSARSALSSRLNGTRSSAAPDATPTATPRRWRSERSCTCPSATTSTGADGADASEGPVT